MRRWLLAVLLIALPLAAQETKKEESKSPQIVQKLIMLKYADPENIVNVLRVFGAPMTPNRETHTIGIATNPQTLQAIEDAIARLDTPAAAPKNIDLTMQLVLGSDLDAQAGALPKDLESVVTQLRNAFPFKSYHLLDVLTIRTRTGQRAGTDSSGGSIGPGTGGRLVTSSFNVNSSSIAPDGTTIRLDGLRCSSKIPHDLGNGQFQYQDLSMNTDVDIKEGQKVVVGRQGINKEQALFLVLSAKVVQ